MRTKVLVATTAMASVVLLAGCSSGGPGGGPGGQQVTAVNLNTNGASPGGANTAEVATAVNAFLATLDPASGTGSSTGSPRTRHARPGRTSRQPPCRAWASCSPT